MHRTCNSIFYNLRFIPFEFSLFTFQRPILTLWALLTWSLMLFGQEPEINAKFTTEFIQEKKGEMEFSVPETFELANILLALSKWGNENGSRNYFKNTKYFQRVEQYFANFKSHPVFDSLDRIDFNNYNNFIGFRDNSTLFRFENDGFIQMRMFDSWWNERWLPNHFENFNHSIADFAIKSRFRDFYRSNIEFYKEQIIAMVNIVALDQMYTWLESNFHVHFDSYQIYFSPLMRGNHSASIKHGNDFDVIYIAISGPQLAENRSDGTGNLLITRQVFTEIDHGYIDPTSVLLMTEIRSSLTEPTVWYGNEEGFYSQPFAFFNEYMTWGAMLLYIKDHYPMDVYLSEKEKTINYMVGNRQFIAFSAFYDKLESLYEYKNSKEKLSDLFLPILKWAQEYEQK